MRRIRKSDRVCGLYLSSFFYLLLVSSIPGPAWADSPEDPNKPKLFSPDSFWNKKLADEEPIDQDSDRLVAALVQESKITLEGMKNPWINRDSYSTSLYIIDSSTKRFPVTIVDLSGKPRNSTRLYEEAQNGIPIPLNAVAGAGTDGHITLYDKDADILYEFWQFWHIKGRWQASWGGILRNASGSDGIMPTVDNKSGGKEYWGATATSLPVIGGTILLEELKTGKIPHALAMSIARPQDTYVWPAQRSDGDPSGIIPEGTRFRLKPDDPIDPDWPPILKMMVEAARDHGIVVRDRTSSIVTFYAEDPRPHGVDPYPCYFGGMELEKIMQMFPFDRLAVLKNPDSPKKHAPESRMDRRISKDTPTSELEKERMALLASYDSVQTLGITESKAIRALLGPYIVAVENELVDRGALRHDEKTKFSWETLEESQELEALKRTQTHDPRVADFVDRRLHRFKIKVKPPALPVDPVCGVSAEEAYG